MEGAQTRWRKWPVVRRVQVLQRDALALGIGTRQHRRVLLAPDLRDELEPAVEQPHGGAIVLRDQLAKLPAAQGRPGRRQLRLMLPPPRARCYSGERGYAPSRESTVLRCRK